MSLSEPLAVTFAVIEVLETLAVPYFLGGSFASSVQGAARATLDADVIADLRPDNVRAFIDTLKDAFYLDPDTVRNAIHRRGTFNLIHFKTMFKVDVFVSKNRPFEQSQFARRRVSLLARDPDLSAYLSSPEDTILAKLEWYRLGGEVSDRQWRDVLSVLQVQQGRLDEDYLQSWAAQLGVADLLRRALDEVA